jgi:hypothetical protein
LKSEMHCLGEGGEWLLKVTDSMKWQQKETYQCGQDWLKNVVIWSVSVLLWENFLHEKRQTKMCMQQNNSGTFYILCLTLSGWTQERTWVFATWG